MNPISGILLKYTSKYKKEDINTYDSIVKFESLNLLSLGENDTEGYQVFTPKFIVEQMCDSIGEDIFDYTKTVLEPTSGDGAFTTYILEKRLDKVFKDNFEIESLKALSTIYSIEMDENLIVKQRNNIYTVICNYIKNNSIEVSEHYFDMVKCIIVSNFMWAMFNSENSNDGFLVEVAYSMPQALKDNLKPLQMPVWEINDNDISLHYEEVEIW